MSRSLLLVSAKKDCGSVVRGWSEALGGRVAVREWLDGEEDGKAGASSVVHAAHEPAADAAAESDGAGHPYTVAVASVERVAGSQAGFEFDLARFFDARSAMHEAELAESKAALGDEATAMQRLRARMVAKYPPRFGDALLYADSVTSTQTILNEELAGLSDTVVFTCSRQVQGRGRGSNPWESPAGCLMFSLKTRVSIKELRYLLFLQYLVSLCVVKGVHRVNPDVNVRLKWPNDLYTDDGQKIGGVLVQTSMWEGDVDIVIGMGLNVDNEKPTTCLNAMARAAAAANDKPVKRIEREELLAHILREIELALVVFRQSGFVLFEREYLQHWLHSDQEVSVAASASVKTTAATGEAIEKSSSSSSSSSSSPSSSSSSQPPSGDRRAVIKGLTADGFLRAQDASNSDVVYELRPDGNSFDFLHGLVIGKKL